ncbi:MAG: bifunctional glutamate N-acetyltransferase/amino-acid acetyltransferase ArgJ, partial [Chloroflexota bacterium]
RIPRGFLAAGRSAGIKRSGRPDLALVVTTDGPAAAAAVFTPNRFAAAPVRLSREVLAASSGWVRAVVSSSGCANAATGPDGDADQRRVGELVAATLGISDEQVLHFSTGIIGTRLPLDRIAAGLEAIAPELAASDAGLEAAASALRTTDTTTKVATVLIDLPRAPGAPGDAGATVPVRVTGIAKGVGMIHPNMATMLSLVLTDATADPALLASILRPVAARTWNQLSVDGDTSTNDTVFLLASGAAGGAPVIAGTPAGSALAAAVEAVARDLARQQAADGEGATCLLTCRVRGGADDADARAVARAVISSSLVKAAAHGKDPNWGRIAGAAGNARVAVATVLEAAGFSPTDAAARAGSQASLDPDLLRIWIAGHLVFDGPAGGPQSFDRTAARADLDAPEILIELELGLGAGTGEAFGCDLTETYVRENSEYTT